ncbi:GNAT family N-acetyltransferase [Wukongibacter sp. M2B1]|uniref:GNAT family N-acetyltransferase n=1 Tax=Wukongibacter sp. M2B1 TaxID=3088895 RepID=UPI003D796140
MSIRLAKYDDLETLVEIYNQAIVKGKCTADMDTLSVEQRVPWFKEHQSLQYPLYVYEINGRVVGYMYLSGYRPGRRAMRFTCEVSYYIHNDYQGQGIGTKFLAFSIKKSKELDYKTLVAILLDWNIPSIKLLKKFGFEEWGCLPNIADFDGETCSHLYYGLKL